MKNHRHCRALLAAFVVVGMAAAAQAQTAALSFSGGSSLTTFSTVIGWRFTLASPVTVTSLGFFDIDGDGLAIAHTVGIYDTGSQAAVLVGLVSAGVADPISAGFRYTSSLSGFATLPAGDYVIAASGDENVMGIVSGLTTASPVAYVENRFEFAGGLAFPTQTFAPQEQGFFGPNFQFTTSAAAPEPTTVGLLGLGLGSLLVARRRKR